MGGGGCSILHGMTLLSRRSAIHTSAAALLLLCSGCPDPEPTPPSDPAWQVVFDEPVLDRVALSVWGDSAQDVFVVGGPLGNSGYEALALHFDGSAWRDLAPGGSDTFWWVAGLSAQDVWMVGENGRITHYDGSGFQEHTSSTTATIWGVWPFAADDVWAVAGTPGGGMAEPNDIVLHYDGSSWTQVPLPTEYGVALNKVWGPSPDELYAVGENGTIWHYKGGSWMDESGAASGTLFTVHGCSATEVYAVGGVDVLLSSGDGNWVKQDVDLNSSVNGVSCAASGVVVLAGGGGLKQRLVDGSWINEFTTAPFTDLHAAWAGGADEMWVVGGDFFNPPSANMPRRGVVARFGREPIADTLP